MKEIMTKKRDLQMGSTRFFLYVVLAVSCGAQAYELRTHAELTLSAFNRSVLVSDGKVSKDLGLDLNSSNPFGDVYFRDPDNRAKAALFEVKSMNDTVSRLSIPGWLMRGAIREDDLTPTGCFFANLAAHNVPGECNPQDASPNINRVVNHFYDPYRNIGLNSFFANGMSAVDWATGTQDAFATPPIPNKVRGNRFSLLDARQAMFNALSGTNSANEDTRKAWWATTFRALGDAMHLLQDMGQPQHTRNEAHPGSVYEAYIDARAAGTSSYKIDGTTDEPLPELTYAGYAVPTFPRYSDFWSTGAGDNSLTGQGLANYANRAFLTDGTNLNAFPTPVYPTPSRNRSDYDELEADNLGLGAPGAVVKFLLSRSAETNLGDRQMRISTESSLNDFSGNVPRYSLNRFNYDDQADLLLPRAVAYSAGLLDYFFRGKIDMVPDPENMTNYIIKNLGKENMSGKFSVYYDDVNGIRRPVSGGTWYTLAFLYGEPLMAGAEMHVPGFGVPSGVPTIPQPKDERKYILVFTGDIGEEKAIPNKSIGAVAAKYFESAPGDCPIYQPAIICKVHEISEVSYLAELFENLPPSATEKEALDKFKANVLSLMYRNPECGVAEVSIGTWTLSYASIWSGSGLEKTIIETFGIAPLSIMPSGPDHCPGILHGALTWGDTASGGLNITRERKVSCPANFEGASLIWLSSYNLDFEICQSVMRSGS